MTLFHISASKANLTSPDRVTGGNWKKSPVTMTLHNINVYPLPVQFDTHLYAAKGLLILSYTGGNLLKFVEQIAIDHGYC